VEQGGAPFSDSVTFNAPAANPCSVMISNPLNYALTFEAEGRTFNWYGLQMDNSVEKYYDDINTKKPYTIEPLTDYAIFYFGSLNGDSQQVNLNWKITPGQPPLSKTPRVSAAHEIPQNKSVTQQAHDAVSYLISMVL
jgi:hypothetical protein